ncbi:hypothetical protein LCM10_04960 [Rossellomorea aquimaris]|uniref:hypothetical protein n=1 Tax=Rossellomorea aquimaris TaxID=189382 RepID=UPI001CD77CD0|nr:hypothetical protein [Rossellomorea aquimaris]MCA1054329.1 hypothetical protein [Rossellomorea aquimaris]
MSSFIGLTLAALLWIQPIIAGAEIKGYERVSGNDEENISLYAKKMDDLYRDFKIDIKGVMYSQPFWASVTNPSYAPQIICKDINNDHKRELIIVLTKGYGTGVLWEDVHVFDTSTTSLNEVIVDHPLAIIHKNVKTKLTPKEANVIVGDKSYSVDITPLKIKQQNLFDHVSFGSTIDYEVKDNQLTVNVGGQISPASSIGSIVINYEYRDDMYQAKSIEFEPYQ